MFQLSLNWISKCGSLWWSGKQSEGICLQEIVCIGVGLCGKGGLRIENFLVFTCGWLEKNATGRSHFHREAKEVQFVVQMTKQETELGERAFPQRHSVFLVHWSLNRRLCHLVAPWDYHLGISRSQRRKRGKGKALSLKRGWGKALSPSWPSWAADINKTAGGKQQEKQHKTHPQWCPEIAALYKCGNTSYLIFVFPN